MDDRWSRDGRRGKERSIDQGKSVRQTHLPGPETCLPALPCGAQEAHFWKAIRANEARAGGGRRHMCRWSRARPAAHVRCKCRALHLNYLSYACCTCVAGRRAIAQPGSFASRRAGQLYVGGLQYVHNSFRGSSASSRLAGPWPGTAAVPGAKPGR